MADKEIVINVKRSGGGVANAVSGGSFGGVKGGGGILGSLSGALGKGMAAGAGFGVLMASSKSLQRTVERMLKLIMMVLRPIGDMLSIILQPLMMLIKPLAIFINGLFRPYLIEARKAFRTGTGFMQLGMPGKAADAFFTGIQLMMAPIIKLLVISLGESLKMQVDILLAPIGFFIDAIQGLGNVILSTIPFSDSAREAWNNFMGSLRGGVNALKFSVKEGIDVGIGMILDGIDAWGDGLIEHANDLKAMYEVSKEVHAGLVDNNASSKTIAESMNALDMASKENFRDVLEDIIDKTGLWANETTGFPGVVTGALDLIYDYAEQTKNKMDALFNGAKAAIEAANQAMAAGQQVYRERVREAMNANGDVYGGPITGLHMLPKEEDFVMRGNNVTPFSSEDTLVGFKGSGPGGGVTFDFSGMTIYASDADEVKRKLDELVQEAMNRLR